MRKWFRRLLPSWLAISLLVPGVPLSILITCLEVSVVTLLLHAPLTGILLVTVVAGAGGSPDLLGLITVSAATSVVAGMVLQGIMARRNAQAQPVPAGE